MGWVSWRESKLSSGCNDGNCIPISSGDGANGYVQAGSQGWFLGLSSRPATAQCGPWSRSHSPLPRGTELAGLGGSDPQGISCPVGTVWGFSVVCCDQIPLPMEPGPLVCCFMPSWTCAPPSAVALPSFHTFPRQILLEKMTINVVFLGLGKFSPLAIRVRGSTLAQSGVQ